MTDPREEYREEFRHWVRERAETAAREIVDLEAPVWLEIHPDQWGDPSTVRVWSEIIARHFEG